ncbi:MAG: permease prefix domain 1-containing protein [Defluviitaleaceae bacterium]|nr:permease prefix domain 1-containing protein [Defluviitaleaceae bacterium]
MEDKLHRYIESIFEDTTPTKKATELKEEMLLNLQDKYRGLIEEGKSPEAAFNIAVASIGDVRVLLRQLEEDSHLQPDAQRLEKARRKSAMLTSIAIMMYILAALPVIIFETIGNGNSEAGIPILIIMVAAATGLLIYNNMTKPRMLHKEEAKIAEIKDKDEENEYYPANPEGRKMRASISTALWSLITVTYFLVSFTTNMWHISWVIFIAGGLIESLINIFFAAKNKGE